MPQVLEDSTRNRQVVPACTEGCLRQNSGQHTLESLASGFFPLNAGARGREKVPVYLSFKSSIYFHFQLSLLKRKHSSAQEEFGRLCSVQSLTRRI